MVLNPIKLGMREIVREAVLWTSLWKKKPRFRNQRINGKKEKLESNVYTHALGTDARLFIRLKIFLHIVSIEGCTWVKNMN